MLRVGLALLTGGFLVTLNSTFLTRSSRDGSSDWVKEYARSSHYMSRLALFVAVPLGATLVLLDLVAR